MVGISDKGASKYRKNCTQNQIIATLESIQNETKK